MLITVALETVKNAFTFRGMSHSCFRCIRHRSHWNSLTEFQHTRFTSPLPLSSRLRATFFVKPRLIPIMLSFNFYVNRLFLMLSITSKLGSESQSSLQRHAYRWRLVSCLFIQPQSLCFQINLITACSLVKWAVFVYFSNFCEANTFFYCYTLQVKSVKPTNFMLVNASEFRARQRVYEDWTKTSSTIPTTMCAFQTWNLQTNSILNDILTNSCAWNSYY